MNTSVCLDSHVHNQSFPLFVCNCGLFSAPDLSQQTLSIPFIEDQYKDVTGRPCLAFDLCCSKSKNQRSSLMQLCGSGMIYDAAEQLNESTMSLPVF